MTDTKIDSMFKMLASKAHKVKSTNKEGKTTKKTWEGYEFDMGSVTELKDLAFEVCFFLDHQTMPNLLKITMQCTSILIKAQCETRLTTLSIRVIK